MCEYINRLDVKMSGCTFLYINRLACIGLLLCILVGFVVGLLMGEDYADGKGLTTSSAKALVNVEF